MPEQILFLNPPQGFREGNIWKKIMSSTPPLGLALLAALLEGRGHELQIVDINAERLDRDGLLARLKGLRAGGFDPRWVGITSSTNTFPAAVETSALSREIYPSARTVFGGVHSTVIPEDALVRAQADYVVRGEGEQSFLELIDGGDAAGIRGLSFVRDGAVHHNPDREDLTDLEKLPIAAYHLLPMKLYHPSLGSYRRLPAIGTVISRGCPGRCTFCFGHHLGRLTRYRPLESVIEEIRILQKNWGIREIAFYDDTFTARRPYVRSFCEALLSEGIDLSWSCFSRVDFVTKELLMLMKKAGCHQICYGIESGEEQILKNIRKKVSFPKARETMALTKRAGIETRATFMLGSPGETPATMESTLRAAIELDPDIALFNITTPYPGTEMFTWADAKGYLVTKDWGAYDLSRPIMRLPTLSEEELLDFYGTCHRRFYSRPGYLLRRLLRIRSLEDLRTNWRAFRMVVLGS